MKPHHFKPFLALSLLVLLPPIVHSSAGKVPNTIQPVSRETPNRRILHQPLFPAPPPEDEPSPDQPFSPETPNSPNPDQIPPPPPSTGDISSPIPAAPKPIKKVAIGVSVGIVTLGILLSALAFFFYRQRATKQSPPESEKIVGGNPQSFGGEPLYVGTVEPSNNGTDGSPYHKLNFLKRLDQDRYRPSPELQPLPPLLTKPPLTRRFSPSSDDDEEEDDESRETTSFHTPSVMSNSTGIDENFYTPVSRQSQLHNTTSSAATKVDINRHVVVPSKKQTPIPPPPPPPPNLLVLRSVIGSTPQNVIPIPPPPPPLPLVAQSKLGVFETSVSSTNSQLLQNQQPQVPNAKTTFCLDESHEDGDCSERLEVDEIEEVKPKLKPLHWDKVRAPSDRATVWDQLQSSSFQLNEDMMESLFGCNSTNVVQNESTTTRKPIFPLVERESRVLDPKKSQNIAILLRALNVTRDEVAEALLDGNPEGLGADLLETLVKMAPTKEEEIKLRDYNGDITKLGSAERFLKAVLEIPFAFKRVEAMLYRANFDAEVKYLRNSYQTLEAASEELKNSQLFLKLLQAVLGTGNRMNVGTNRGDAKAFKLDTLLKLVDIKGADGRTTLLHFVVQEIIRSEGSSPLDPPNENCQDQTYPNTNEESFTKQGLQVLAGLSRELDDVKKTAGMDADVLSSYVSKLELGLEKVRLVLQYEMPNMQGKFFDLMKLFLQEADEEINKIKADERKALSHVKEVTEYFHGDAAKEEAHPLRIFMIVRDFLSILDHVCKEVGRMQDKAIVGSAKSFRMPSSASLQVVNRFNVRQDEISDEENSSP